MSVSFISVQNGVIDQSVTVPAGADLMVVGIGNATEQLRTSASFNGQALSAAELDNEFAALFYMLAPPVGTTAQLSVTPNNAASQTVVAFYSTTASGFTFQGGQQASAGSASYSPSGAGVVCHIISATSAGTPVAGTNERYDSGSGDWYGDRIVTGAGAVTVGATISNPDYAGAIFLEAASGASLTATAAFAAGAASSATSATRVRSAAAAFAAGSASSSGSVDRIRNLTAAFAAGSASSGTSAQVSGNRTLTAAFQAGSAAMSSTATRVRGASGAFAAGSASFSATAAISQTHTVGSAAFQAGSASFSTSATRTTTPVFPGTGKQRIVTASGAQTLLAERNAQRIRTAQGKQRLTSWNE
jgi:hypothetical protein